MSTGSGCVALTCAGVATVVGEVGKMGVGAGVDIHTDMIGPLVVAEVVRCAVMSHVGVLVCAASCHTGVGEGGGDGDGDV